MSHRQALDCPCRPEIRDQVGGGRVYVHRRFGDGDGRETPSTRAPDRRCPTCPDNTYHFVGHPHLVAA